MIARREWHWVALWAAVALLVASVPTWLGRALSTPEMEFGGAVYNVEDVHSYLADMRQGWRGEWLFHNPYTPEEHPGALVYLHYLMLGKVAARSGLSLEATYYLAQVACGALLLFAVYHFLSQFTPHLAVRRVAFLLIAFSSGLGWLLVAIGRGEWLGSLPIDLISPEGYVFLTLYSPPHIALVTAGLLWGVVHVSRASHICSVLAGGLAFAGVAVIGAFYLLVPFAVLCIYWLVTAWRRRQADWRALALIGLTGLPPALPAVYTVVVFTGHPVYRAWTAQNQVRSLHPLHYAAGYAIPGALALLGIVHTVRRRQRRLRWRQNLALPIVWILLAPVLLYIPLNVQRRLIIGAQVPLGLLAARALVAAIALPFGHSSLVRRLLTASPCSPQGRGPGHSRIPRYSPRKLRRVLIAAVILATVPSNLLLIAGTSLRVVRRAPPIYRPRAELAALDWLRVNTSPRDTVLCAYETGNYLPARAGNRVVIGLGPQTVDVERKRVEVQRFYAVAEEGVETDAWRQELLRRYGVAYVLVGPHERALGREPAKGAMGHRGYDPGAAPYLEKVYDAGGYTIYRVLARSLASSVAS